MNFHEKTTDAGGATYENSRFDMMTFRDHNITYLEDDHGNKQSFICNERYYIPPEITWLLKTLEFNKIKLSRLTVPRKTNLQPKKSNVMINMVFLNAGISFMNDVFMVTLVML